MNTYAQDPDAHLFYVIDWTKWLQARDYTDSDIISFEWVLSNAFITKTTDAAEGAKARVYLKDAQVNKKTIVTCRITCTNFDDGGDPVVDDYSFAVIGSLT